MLAALPVAAQGMLAGPLGMPDLGNGFVPPAEMCFPDSGLTSLAGCQAMSDISHRCKDIEPMEERLKCACVQELLNSYEDCKSDIYKCIKMTIFDENFDNLISDWHRACDAHTSVTAPPEPTLTATFNPDDCFRLAGSCYSADYSTNLCMQQWLPTSSVSFISCACQPPIYSLFSECQYNGNVSCYLRPAFESNILGHRECSYFWTGSETLPPVDMTSFLSLTDAARMKATDAADALREEAANRGPGPRKTWTTVVQTSTPEIQEDL